MKEGIEVVYVLRDTKTGRYWNGSYFVGHPKYYTKKAPIKAALTRLEGCSWMKKDLSEVEILSCIMEVRSTSTAEEFRR